MKIQLFIFMCTIVGTINGAPSKTSILTKQKYPVEDLQLIHPQIITIERFEALLRRAGEIFHPTARYDVVDNTKRSDRARHDVAAANVETPSEHMQPPPKHPYNFYLPLYDYDDITLDSTSRKLENIAPPPLEPITAEQTNTNYYAALKPKKLPKKFNIDAKHINTKWLSALHNYVTSDGTNAGDGDGEMLQTAYLANDERNRINFDDSFFGVDMQVKIPDNDPHKELKNAAIVRSHHDDGGGDEFLNQGEEVAEEDDLLASAAVQLPHISEYSHKTRGKK